MNIGWVAIFLILVLNNAHALSINGDEETENEKQGLVSLYLFNETTGPYLDTANNGQPLNLNVSAAAAAAITRSRGSLLINTEVPSGGIASSTAATKIIDQCKASNELTVEAYIRTTRDNQNGPARIATLSSGPQNRNFTLGHRYNGEGHFVLRIRTSKNGGNGSNRQPESAAGAMIQSDNPADPPQHVVMTRDALGTVRIFIDGVLSAEDASGSLGGDFGNWDDTMRLAIGNELDLDPDQSRRWRGEIHLFAVFCRAKTLKEIVGDVSFIEMPVVKPGLDSEIDDNQTLALQIYKRLTGIAIPIDSPVITQMAERIKSGNVRAAAEIATASPHFYNFLVRDFAAKMSTREESVKTPLNDFIATTIGVVRDEMSAKTLLTGNFYYRGAPGKTAVPSNTERDIVRSNNHYAQLEEQTYDLSDALIREEGQKILTSAEEVVVNPDAAGLLTTRGFMQAHAAAGTNRRLVEFTFRQFLCTPIEHWADATSSDANVGRDIDRYPGGKNAKFQTTCKSCHSNMDGLRGAFARFDFSDGIIKNALFMNSARNPDDVGPLEMAQNPIGISAKFNHNSDVFPEGFMTTDTSWINNANRGANAAKFGWRDDNGQPIAATAGSITGTGVNQLGRMISNSRAFSQCMTKRVFASTCGREVTELEKTMVDNLSNQFESANHNLRKLFEMVVSSPECLGLSATGGQ